jgi:SAM-dependent methyltransferase
MKVFDQYAQFYDFIYQEKNYETEARFIQRIFDQYPGLTGKNVLDLGCGTGGHALPLSTLGYQVTGVDLSDRMIAQAKRKAKDSDSPVEFLLGDIRSINLGKKFDYVISMFAVMGYQTSNDDLFSAMQVARRHLNSGGLFIFDAWFGPAVLKFRPEARIKEFFIGDQRIIRIAIPELNLIENTVLVQYTIFQTTADRIIDETREAHLMRFLFSPEVAFFARQAGFKVQKVCPFMNLDKAPDDQDWNVTWVLQAV